MAKILTDEDLAFMRDHTFRNTMPTSHGKRLLATIARLQERVECDREHRLQHVELQLKAERQRDAWQSRVEEAEAQVAALAQTFRGIAEDDPAYSSHNESEGERPGDACLLCDLDGISEGAKVLLKIKTLAEQWVRHDTGCGYGPSRHRQSDGCDCGLTEARAAIDITPEEAREKNNDA